MPQTRFNRAQLGSESTYEELTHTTFTDGRLTTVSSESTYEELTHVCQKSKCPSNPQVGIYLWGINTRLVSAFLVHHDLSESTYEELTPDTVKIKSYIFKLKSESTYEELTLDIIFIDDDAMSSRNLPMRN